MVLRKPIGLSALNRIETEDTGLIKANEFELFRPTLDIFNLGRIQLLNRKIDPFSCSYTDKFDYTVGLQNMTGQASKCVMLLTCIENSTTTQPLFRCVFGRYHNKQQNYGFPPKPLSFL